MTLFKTRPNLSNLQFRQEPGTELDLKGKTKILPGGQIRIKYDEETGEYGELVLEGPTKSFGSLPFVRATEEGVLYKEYIDLSGYTTSIYQENHGFVVGDVVGFEEIPEVGEGKYTKAIADGTYPGEPLGLATEIISEDEFVLMQTGFTVFNFDETHPNSYLLNLIPGKVYYLSSEEAGKMVDSAPTEGNNIQKAVFLPVKDSLTNERNRGWILPYPAIKTVRGFKAFTITGNGLDTDFVVRHDFNTFDLVVQSYRMNPPRSIIHIKNNRDDENNMEIKFTKPPQDGEEFRILIGG